MQRPSMGSGQLSLALAVVGRAPTTALGGWGGFRQTAVVVGPTRTIGRDASR